MPGKKKIVRTEGQDEDGYLCVNVEDVWHLIQEQANPPPANSQGAWTSCSIWAGFKRGLNRRLPDCPYCLSQVQIEDERKIMEAGRCIQIPPLAM